MKTILLPTDLTNSTHAALIWARLFANRFKARLVLLHVQAPPMPDATMPVIGDLGLGTGVLTDTTPIHEEQLTALARQLQVEGITCETDLRRGSIKDAVLEAATRHGADLIITGRSQISNLFERFIGTSATGIARAAHCPVLIVPSHESDDTTRPVDLKTIVFSTPLEFDQDVIFGQVVELARTFNASLRVLKVQAENQPNLTSDEEIISQLQAVYGAEPLPVDTVESGSVTGGLEDYLNSHSADLLVMTTRERDFLSGLLNPSLTSRMVVLSNIPVLVYQTKGDL